MKCNQRNHCVCFKCANQQDCIDFKETHEKHLHRWACNRTNRNLLVEHFQKVSNEMIQLSKVSFIKK